MPRKFWAFTAATGTDGQPVAGEVDLTVYGYLTSGESWWDDDVSAIEFRQALDEHKDASTINVRINSGGGDAFAGIAMQNALVGHSAHINVIVEGLAGSAASLVAMAGRDRAVGDVSATGRVTMGPGSMLMVHGPSTIACGNAGEMRRTAEELDKLQGAMVGIYEAKCGKTRDEIQAWMGQDTWMTAEEAIAAGLADRIGGAAPIAPTARDGRVFLASVGYPVDALPEAIRRRLPEPPQAGPAGPLPAPRIETAPAPALLPPVDLGPLQSILGLAGADVPALASAVSAIRADRDAYQAQVTALAAERDEARAEIRRRDEAQREAQIEDVLRLAVQGDAQGRGRKIAPAAVATWRATGRQIGAESLSALLATLPDGGVPAGLNGRPVSAAPVTTRPAGPGDAPRSVTSNGVAPNMETLAKIAAAAGKTVDQVLQSYGESQAARSKSAR